MIIPHIRINSPSAMPYSHTLIIEPFPQSFFCDSTPQRYKFYQKPKHLVILS